MTERVQAFLLRNTTSLQYLINEKLAKRPGIIGTVFKKLEIGQRQYGQHAHGRIIRMGNWWWMVYSQQLAHTRQIISRIWLGSQNGPLNFSGLFLFCWCTWMICSRLNMDRHRDTIAMNC